jgi:hypothetical protein
MGQESPSSFLNNESIKIIDPKILPNIYTVSRWPVQSPANTSNSLPPLTGQPYVYIIPLCLSHPFNCLRIVFLEEKGNACVLLGERTTVRI